MHTAPDPRDHAVENWLSALTDAILADAADLDSIADRYALPRREVDGFVHIVQRLHVALVGVQPSRRFVTRLKSDLIGDARPGMFGRIRHLPPRVQIAGMVMVMAGFMLLSVRHLRLDSRKSTPLLGETSLN